MASQTSTPPSKPVQPQKLMVLTNDAFIAYSKSLKMSIEIFYLEIPFSLSALILLAMLSRLS